MIVPEAVDGECALAFHWAFMNSLKQFLLLAVQNAEQESETPSDAIMYACFIGFFVFGCIVCLTIYWIVMKKHNPNLTAAQFWRAVFTPNISGRGSGGGD